MKKTHKNKQIFLIIILISILSCSSIITFLSQAEEMNSLGFHPSNLSVEIGSTFTLTAYACIKNEVDTVEITNFTWTPTNIINYTSCAQGTLFQGTVIYFDPDAPPGEYHNDKGWAKTITQSVILSFINNTNGTLGHITWQSVGIGTTILQITNGTTLRNGIDKPTQFNQDATVTVHPKPPKNFTAQKNSPNTITLNWTKGYGANHTKIIANQHHTPQNPTDGIELYNHTNTTYTHTIQPGQTWHYAAWSYTKHIHSLAAPTTTIQSHNYTLTTNITGNGTLNITPNQTSYPPGTTITLNATPDPNWHFRYYLHHTPQTTNPYSFNINENTTITAEFIQQYYTLNLNTNGSGNITIQPPGNIYPQNTTITLIAHPNTGWQFTHWSGNISGNTNPYTFTLTQNITGTAHFTQKNYTLTTNTQGQGTITRTPNQTTYHHGDTITLTAHPQTGWVFNHWNDDHTGTTNPTNYTIIKNASITANFTKQLYTLSKTTIGDGTIHLNPDLPSYQHNQTVIITAIPNLGWRFSHWSHNLTGTTNPQTLTIHNNTLITAHFTQKNYTLTTNSVGNGTITINPEKIHYHLNDTITLTASPQPGWYFVTWKNDLNTTTSPTTITITKNTSITALFNQTQYTLTTHTQGTGNGTIEYTPTGPYQHGDHITFWANASNGSTFTQWHGDHTSTNNPTTLTITKHTTIIAEFIPKEYTITTTKNGQGTITRTPNQTTYHHGDTVTLNANPTTNWTFQHWRGDITSTKSPLTITITQNLSLTAHFTQQTPAPPPNNGGGGGSGPPTPPPLPTLTAKIKVTPSTTALILQQLTFDATNSIIPENMAPTYQWIISDTITKNGSKITHQFDTPGTYQIILTISTSSGLTDTNSTTITIIKPNKPPTKPQIRGPTMGKINTTLLYQILTSDLDDPIIQCTINWGDNTEATIAMISNGSTFSASHQWIIPGKYQIQATVTDNFTQVINDYTVLINGIYVHDLGHLLDQTNNAYYDIFYCNITTQTTPTEYQKPWYNLDIDNDNQWDYQYNPQTDELRAYEQPSNNTPANPLAIILLFAILLIIAAVLIFYKKH